MSAPGGGLRRLPQTDRRPQARGAHLEAPEVLRRDRGVGRGLLTHHPSGSPERARHPRPLLFPVA
ncbi:hypothetical protein SGPA1_11914 [Streptomyces misionensis JCM 4497]